MISRTVHRTFHTTPRREFIRISGEVAAVVGEGAIVEGMALRCAMRDGGRRTRPVIKVLGE